MFNIEVVYTFRTGSDNDQQKLWLKYESWHKPVYFDIGPILTIVLLPSVVLQAYNHTAVTHVIAINQIEYKVLFHEHGHEHGPRYLFSKQMSLLVSKSNFLLILHR